MLLPETSVEQKELKVPEKEELVEIDSSPIEEEITIIENHFFDEPLDGTDILDSDELVEIVEEDETVVDVVDEISDEERICKG